MYIVVIGMGKVGTALTESLSGEGHDIVVIDNKSDVIENAVNKSDVMALLGNGATYRVQKEAGVEKAELLIAVTPSDELNILCCMIGRKIGAKIQLRVYATRSIRASFYLCATSLGSA